MIQFLENESNYICITVDFLIPDMCFFSAIATVVTIAEILKNNGLAVEKSEILFTFLSS